MPADVSVVGFDDIKMATYSNPSLTTVRQPLLKMGEMSARALLSQIKNSEEYVPEILIEPEFAVRKSTAKPRVHSPGCSERLDGVEPRGLPDQTE